jgi:hypothetical protein
MDVQALDAHGHVLRSSRVHAVPRHVDVFAQRVFVSSATGQGTVPIGCFTGHTCHVRVRIAAKRSVLASTGPEKVFSGRGELVPFHLSSHGLAALKAASGHGLPVQVSVKDSSGARAKWNVVLLPYSTSGPGPSRSLHQSSTVHILGATEFVSSGGSGGILAACYAPSPCRVRTTITARGTQIAAARPQRVGVNEVDYVRFQLTPAGRSMLANSAGNQLAATVSLTSGGRTATGRVALVRYQ